MGFTIFFLTVQFLQPTLLHIHIHTSPQLFTSVVRILQNTSDTLQKQKREMETVQWWNCCGNTWRCVAMCIVRDVYSGLPVEVVQWVSLIFYPFLICLLSHSGGYTLTSLNLVYEVLLFSTLIPCQHQEEWPQLGDFPRSGIRNKQVSDIESGYPDIESGYPDIRI